MSSCSGCEQQRDHDRAGDVAEVGDDREPDRLAQRPASGRALGARRQARASRAREQERGRRPGCRASSAWTASPARRATRASGSKATTTMPNDDRRGEHEAEARERPPGPQAAGGRIRARPGRSAAAGLRAARRRRAQRRCGRRRGLARPPRRRAVPRLLRTGRSRPQMLLDLGQRPYLRRSPPPSRSSSSAGIPAARGAGDVLLRRVADVQRLRPGRSRRARARAAKIAGSGLRAPALGRGDDAVEQRRRARSARAPRRASSPSSRRRPGVRPRSRSSASAGAASG